MRFAFISSAGRAILSFGSRFDLPALISSPGVLISCAVTMWFFRLPYGLGANRASDRLLCPLLVRELRNVVERSVLLATGEVFPERWLQFDQGPAEPDAGASVEGNRVVIPLDGSMDLDQMESYIIQTSLERNDYNVTATARALGTTRETLRYRIQKYDLKTDGDEQ